MGSKSTTSTATQQLPGYINDAYKKLVSSAQGTGSQAYTPYTGGFTSDQQTAFGNIGSLWGSSNGAFGAANDAYGKSLVPTSETVGSYMSPYMDQVISNAMANMQEQNAQGQQQVIGDAIAKGAMGGNRVGVAQSELARQQKLADGQTLANLYNSGYNTALGAAQADKSAALQAAQGYGNLGQTQMQTNLAQAGAQLGAGTQQQQFDYQQYLNAQAYPYQQQSWLASILGGLGSTAGGTTSQTTPQGNMFSQILGTGLQVAGLFSDRRVKEDVREIGRSFDGQPIYSYRYKGAPETHIGFMAQEVEKKHPEAVGERGGVMTVDYDRATEDAARKGRFARGGTVAGFAMGGIPYANNNGEWGSFMSASMRSPYANDNGDFGSYIPQVASIGGGGGNFPTIQQPAEQEDPFAAPGVQKGADNIKSWLSPTIAGGAAIPKGGFIPGITGPKLFAGGGVVGRNGYAFGGRGNFPTIQQFEQPDDPLANPTDLMKTGASNIKSWLTPKVDASSVRMPALYSGGGVVGRNGYAFGGMPTYPTVDPYDDLLLRRRDEGLDIPEGVAPKIEALTAPKVAPFPPAYPDKPTGVAPVAVGVAPEVTVAPKPAPVELGIIRGGTRAPSVPDMYSKTEGAYGLPPGYLARTAQLESAGNPNARNKSGAAGPFQFMPGTAEQYGLKDPYDPAASTDAAARFAVDNAKVLAEGLGREPTAAELYLAHQQGAGGALALLQNPNAPAATLVGRSAVLQNGGDLGMTGADFANMWMGKFGGDPRTTAIQGNYGNTVGEVPYGRGEQFVTDPRESTYSKNGLEALQSLFAGKGLNLAPDANMGLIQAGAAMAASRSPFFLQGVGEGTSAGIQAWKDYQAMERDNAKARADIGQKGEELAQQATQIATQAGLTGAQTGQTEMGTATMQWDFAPTMAGMRITDKTNPTNTQIVPYASLPGWAARNNVDPASMPGGGKPLTPTITEEGVRFDVPVPTSATPSSMAMYPGTESIVTGQTADMLEKSRTADAAAQDTSLQLAAMRHAAEQLPPTGFLSQGQWAQARGDIAKSLNTLATMAGVQLLFDPTQVGSIEEMNKLTTQFGFALAKTTGSDVAASVIQQGLGAVPGVETSPQGFKTITALIQASLNRTRDYHKFLENYVEQTHGDASGAQTAFNDAAPPSLYANSAILASAVVPKTQADIDNAPAGTLFNIDGQLMVK